MLPYLQHRLVGGQPLKKPVPRLKGDRCSVFLVVSPVRPHEESPVFLLTQKDRHPVRPHGLLQLADLLVQELIQIHDQRQRSAQLTQPLAIIHLPRHPTLAQQLHGAS